MLLSDFIRLARLELEALYPQGEASSIVSILCQERLGVKSYEHIVNPSYEIPEEKLMTLQNDMLRLAGGEPVQYVTGCTYFCDRRFNVTAAVLIPRPETEWLAQAAAGMVHSGAKVLDLCTGSGCIAWTVALEVKEAQVTAVDISKDALALAAAQFDDCGINWLQADILAEDFLPGGLFDIIVSNPPYILENEKAEMRKNVLDFEPGLALFVKEDDPLVFYRAICRVAVACLKTGGSGLVEINEMFASEVAGLFATAGFKEISVIKDFRDKDRFITFKK